MEETVGSAARIERLVAAASKKQLGHVMLATGRGGTGKSTFVTLASRFLARPLLLLDLDPDQCLGDMLGVDLEKERITTEIGRETNIKSLSELATDLVDDEALVELGGGPPFVKIPLLLQWYTMYTSEKFDLITLGPKWNEGDYRAASYIFEFIIPSIGQNYANILVDSPAGLEHLNRKAVARVDDLFLVLDPSMKSIKHIQRVKRITKEVGISYRNLYLVGNCNFDAGAEARLKSQTEDPYLGRIEYDATLKDYNLQGKSLLTLPDDSPACISVKRILEKAGYSV